MTSAAASIELDDYGSHLHGKEPIYQQPAIDKVEVKADIERLVAGYEGEELVQRLTEYVLLSTIEVFLVRDRDPVDLSTMKGPKIDVITNMMSGRSGRNL